MAPIKENVSAYEVLLKKRRKEERKAKPSGMIKKSHEGKLKDDRMRKVKSLLKSAAEEILLEGSVTKKINQKNKIKKNRKEKLSEKPMDEENTSDDDLENDTQMKDESVTNSIEDGKNAFKWLIAPIEPDDFFIRAWEKTPLHVKRADYPDYYKDLLSSEKITKILHEDYVLFSKNVDITSYRDGQRETHNPPGRALPAVVWDFFRKGCSVRMLNPQTFSLELRKLNATLQEFFGCFVGANSYLTPPNSQGFAPHYDDIEAFVLQIEGRKHWKVYAPRRPEEVLPRFSSPNFSQEELAKPVLEATLGPGDLLYFPRGFIHQASTEPGHHSLHITVSCYQKNTWGDLLEKLLPASLAVAMEDDVEFRRGLPLNYLRHAGVSNSDQVSSERNYFMSQLQRLMGRLLQHAPVDAAVDQMGKQFMHDALPPVLSPDEEECSIFSENILMFKDGGVSGKCVLKENSKVKLLRSHVLRLVKEEANTDEVQVYHCIDNSLEYHGEEPQMFEVSSDFALGIEHLIQSYPEFISVSDLKVDGREQKLELVNLLWKKGLLLTEKPVRNSNH